MPSYTSSYSMSVAYHSRNGSMKLKSLKHEVFKFKKEIRHFREIIKYYFYYMSDYGIQHITNYSKTNFSRN